MSMMFVGDQESTTGSSASCPVLVTLTAADIPGSTLNEPLESHGVPALKLRLLYKGLTIPTSWRKQQLVTQ